MQTLLEDIEKILAKMNRELATREDVAVVGRRMALFYDGMLTGTVLGLILAFAVVGVGLVCR